MQTKKVVEFNCQCCVYRNNIKLQVKGEKGQLRKVVISLHQKYPVQSAPPPTLGIKLKQPTLDQMFSRQKKTNEPPKEPLKPLSMEIYLYIYCNCEELFCFNLDQSVNLAQSEIKGSTWNVQFSDKIVSLFDCPRETLLQAKACLIELKNKKQEILNCKSFDNNQTIIQSFQISENDSTSQEKPDQKPLTEMQKAKLQRKQLASQQQQQQDKQIIEKQIVKVRQTEKVTIKQYNKKFSIPQLIWRRIFNFLPTEHLFRLRVVCKQFEQQINQLIIRLSYKRFYEVPFEVVLRSLQKFQYLQSLNFGSLRNLKPTSLIEMKLQPLSNLYSLNISDYQQLTDKLCSKFLLLCDRINKLSLPYNSKITSATITLISQKLENLKFFKLVEKEKGLINDDINYQTYIMLLKLKKLNYLRIPLLQIEFFEKYLEQHEKEQFESINGKLKIGTILFYQVNQVQIKNFLLFLDINNQITKFSLNDLSMKTTAQLKYTVLFNESVFQFFNSIFFLSFGGFVDDEFCCKLCNSNTEIKKLKIRSKFITDEGLKVVLLKCKQLKKIDIANCSMISGVGFEYLTDKSLTLEFPLIEINVSLDEYNVQCLEELLIRKAYEYKLTNQKITKKK